MYEVPRIRREQALRRAEGYIDLISVFADRWPVAPAVRDPLAQRALAEIESLGDLELLPGHRCLALYLQGEALKSMERYHEAIHPLVEASREEPDNIGVWLSLAWCHKRTGRIDLAIQALEEALAAPDSNQAIIYYNLACYWSLARNTDLALEYLSRSFEIDSAFRDLVEEENDFNPIRENAEFRALTSAIV